jgi:hypothetical protein
VLESISWSLMWKFTLLLGLLAGLWGSCDPEL